VSSTRSSNPFYTTKTIRPRGYRGLGLATVYGFIKQTGGFIYVDSELDKGTTFSIFIPRYVPVNDDAAQPPEVAAPRLAGLMPPADDKQRTTTDLTGQGTILLVEDEEGLRALNARGLLLTWLPLCSKPATRRGARLT